MGHFNYDDDYTTMEEHLNTNDKNESLYDKCLAIATRAHKGQYRKWEESNLEYITHPIAVSQDVLLAGNEIAQAAALLHDVLEDTPVTAEDLLAEGVPNEVVQIVKILTRDKSRPYAEYIVSVINSNNIIAMKIKLADLTHNLKSIKPGSLRDKYQLSYYLIEEILMRKTIFQDLGLLTHR